ncbi:hypothetical protein PCANC_00674 [Puccinia coronata f. sp. avenae]|uniref:Uncharacterized protein n=1 Tax=Puccinia coronata f. sp. avenae TaxID=200324 RepID=A0A2N5W6X6_9BASI|nr:hypothetical protein PCANC_00674 [Puccinia coronata f. sp. avenae]
MRYSFIYYAFHLSFSAFTAAMGPGWEGTPMRMQFDLNTVPQMELTAAREFGCEEGTPMRMQFDLNTVPQMEFPPEQRGHRDSQASSSAATDLRRSSKNIHEKIRRIKVEVKISWSKRQFPY